MKELLVGGSGQLGRELQLTKPEGWILKAPDSKALNLLNRSEVMNYVALFAPDIIINAASYTAVDQAESEPKKAFAVNANGAGTGALPLRSGR